MQMKKLIAAFFSLSVLVLHAQEYGRADSLRGFLYPERSCYDVTFYDLELHVDVANQSVSGKNTIHFHAEHTFSQLQLDLFDHLAIEKIEMYGRSLQFDREYGAVHVYMDFEVPQGVDAALTVYYFGKPRAAVNPPWDGGFSWRKDEQGKDWVGVSCQGLGASAWWPNKDHQSDEPDSMRIAVKVPEGLTCVANGNLRSHDKKTNTFEWFVSYPINNYDVSINIGDYVHFSDEFVGEGGVLPLDYYVLSYNKQKAKKHFEQVKPMLACYENFFGAYPFWKDGYALVETPYLGMEHQSAIAYGNRYLSGYRGNKAFIAGLDFDFIIVHETGHEWWGNSITANDIADMWIQESFCTYSEVLFVECMHGYDTMIEYVENQMSMIRNDKPIVGVPHVHQKGSGGDMYQKGSAMLHTLRTLIENDSLWYALIYDMTQHFKHQTIDGVDVMSYINEKSGYDFSDFFQQYLYTKELPELQYYVKEGVLHYRWEAIEAFDMPVLVKYKSEAYDWLYPSVEWKQAKLEVSADKIQFAEHLLLMDVKKLK
jgi:aminopeptidase N